MEYGNIVVLNGAPRSGKTSIARAIQSGFEGVWVNLGVDAYRGMLPEAVQPGIGLRPGGERPELEPSIRRMYAALYDSIAAHSRAGLHVVADFGHHDGYSKPLGILPDCARRLEGLPALFVGVLCPLETILERRESTWGQAPDGEFLAPVRRWQEAVHVPGIYDLTVDTSALTPEACAEKIRARLAAGEPYAAFSKLVLWEG